MTQVRINNFKCFEEAIVPLRRLTFIYGQNSSGKSTIFQAINLIRLVIMQLNKKESRYSKNKEQDKSREDEDIGMDAWKRIPWFRGGISAMQRDKNDPIKIGFTLKLEGDGTEGSTYITTDMSVGNKWDLGKHGNSLPDKIVFGFQYGKLDAFRDKDNKYLDLTITINNRVPENQQSVFSRQFGFVQVSPTLLDWFCREYSPASEQIFRDYFNSPLPLNWGEVPFFKSFNKKPKYPNNDHAFNKAYKWVNGSLERAWGEIEDYLKPALLMGFYSGHISADEHYIGHDIRNTNVRFHLKKEFDDFLNNEKVINQVNEALNLLDTPHRLDSKKGILDLRKQTSEKGSVLTEVGYGIQYLVPRLLLLFGGEHPLCMIEEPEAHVHPRLQAKLGSLFLKQSASADMMRQLIIESHSENLILQIKRNIHDMAEADAETAKKWADNILALYVDYSQDTATPDIEADAEKPQANVEATPRISYIRIDSEGNFMDYWPKGFFPERQENLYY